MGAQTVGRAAVIFAKAAAQMATQRGNSVMRAESSSDQEVWPINMSKDDSKPDDDDSKKD
jgi:hypothetical protein